MEPCRAWLGGRGYAPENEADAPLDEPEEEADAPGVTRAAIELCSAWLGDEASSPRTRQSTEVRARGAGLRTGSNPCRQELCSARLGGRGYAPEDEADAPKYEPEEPAYAPGVTLAAMELCRAWLGGRGYAPENEADDVS